MAGMSNGRLGWIFFITMLGIAAPVAAQKNLAAAGGQFTQVASSAATAEHPLMPVVRWAQASNKHLQTLADYSATFVKRERVGDELTEHQYLFVKVRHQPFSVYLTFLAPAALKGREAIYVEGKNGGNLLAHDTGLKDKLLGTVSIKPDGMLAMQNSRHPITEMGMLNLTGKIARVGEQALQFNESEVRYFPGAKVNGRVCTCIQITNPKPRQELYHHLRRIFVDDEWNVPIRFETYDWPTKVGEQPPLTEEYTYLNLKFNNGFTDWDFDPKNPDYKFK